MPTTPAAIKSHNVYIIAGGVNYYLSGSPTAQTYSGTGTPWTTQANTPYTIAMNDKTGQYWAPNMAQEDTVYGGGPPFRDGSSLIRRNYENIQQAIPIQMRGTSHDNTVFLLQQLRRILKQALFTVPSILAIQPYGSAQTIYYEIYDGEVSETTDYFNQENDQGLIRAIMTITCSYVGGRLSTGQTVLSSASISNTSPSNTANFPSSLSGDQQIEGQPLNIRCTAATSTSITQLFMASVLSVTKVTGTGSSGTSSFTSPATAENFNVTVTSKLTNVPLKVRVVPAVVMSFNAQIRCVFGIGTQTLYGPWIGTQAATLESVIDLGSFPLTTIRRTFGMTAPTIQIIIQVRSLNGSSATANVTYTDILLYYDFALVDTLSAGFGVNVSSVLTIDTFQEQTGAVCLPWPIPQALTVSTTPLVNGRLRGTAPRAYTNAKLWLAWNNASYAHATGTLTVNATQASLWRSLRGGEG